MYPHSPDGERALVVNSEGTGGGGGHDRAEHDGESSALHGG